MAQPQVTARQSPTGIVLKDGFSSVIAFSQDPDVSFWEKAVKPPSYDGGEPIDLTTMHNTLYRTSAARDLISLGPITVRAAYDPAVLDQIKALINKEGSVTVHFPDGSTLAFYGYLRSFDPGDMSEGASPEATVTIVVTNYDPVNHKEEGPVLSSVPGT